MDKEQVEIALNKIFPHIKPEEVSDINFDVRHTAPDEFTLHTSFVVDGDWWDSLDTINKAAFIHKTKMKNSSARETSLWEHWGG
jgi:hypothetical protein